MKSKIWSILVVFALVSIVSSTGLYAQRFEGMGVEWLQEVADPSYTLDELDRIFDNRNLILSNYLMGVEITDEEREKIGDFIAGMVWIKLPNEQRMEGIGKDIAAKLKKRLKDAKSCILYSYKIYINVDIEEYQGSNDPEDLVYPIVEFFKLICHYDNPGEEILRGASSYRHPRKTFR